MKRIGFIVNPIAGMGGRVGLKGTDHMVEEAQRRGAVPFAHLRAHDFLSHIDHTFELWTCTQPMGAGVARQCTFDARIVYESCSPTTADDTIRAAHTMKGCDLIVFVGGDGTAIDVLSAVGHTVPVVGVPAGVKMYSAVFGTTPRHAADIVNAFAEGLPVEEREVIDVDEDAFREGNLVLSVKGFLLVPVHERVQASKSSSTDAESKKIVAQHILDIMDDDTVYVIGGGSTTYELKKMLGIEGTFLGIDVVKGTALLSKDASEEEIKNTLAHATKIIVSPLGGHGFIFGRGNEQISPDIIKRVGMDNIILIATPEKLASLTSLKVDTGDTALDTLFHGYIEVVTGYREKKIMRVE